MSKLSLRTIWLRWLHILVNIYLLSFSECCSCSCCCSFNIWILLFCNLWIIYFFLLNTYYILVSEDYNVECYNREAKLVPIQVEYCIWRFHFVVCSVGSEVLLYIQKQLHLLFKKVKYRRPHWHCKWKTLRFIILFHIRSNLFFNV